MFLRLVVPLACLAAYVAARDGAGAFEPENFNVTKALEGLGVDVEVLPKPERSTIAGRSSFRPCSLAVSTREVLLMELMLTVIAVYVSEHTVW
jgi:hypothetical protein